MHKTPLPHYSGTRPAPLATMRPPFVDSASYLPSEHQSDPLEPTVWGRVLTVALVLTVAACSAALLVH